MSEDSALTRLDERRLRPPATDVDISGFKGAAEQMAEALADPMAKAADALRPNDDAS